MAAFLGDKTRRLIPQDSFAEQPSFVNLSKQLITRFGHEGQPSYFASLLQLASKRDSQGIHELRSKLSRKWQRGLVQEWSQLKDAESA